MAGPRLPRIELKVDMRGLERAIRKAIEIKSLTVGVETDQGGDTWKSVFARALDSVKKKLEKELSAEAFSEIVFPRFVSNKAGSTDESTGQAYGSKVERNSKMLTAYENGQVLHMIGTHKAIESSLGRFPKKPLDLADSWFWVYDDLFHGGSGYTEFAKQAMAEAEKRKVAKAEIGNDFDE